MSLILAMTHQVTTQLQIDPPGSVVLAQAAPGGLLDWATAKNTQTQNLFRGLSITVGIGFVIWVGITTRMAMARVIISGLAAGLLIWFVFNITDVQDRVGNEINGLRSPAVTSSEHVPIALPV